MTAKSPEVIYLIDTGDGVDWCDDPDPTGYGECDDAVKYVRGDAYEALQAECEKLRALLLQSTPIIHAHAGASHMLEGFKPKRNKWDALVEEIDAAHRKQGGGVDHER